MSSSVSALILLAGLLGKVLVDFSLSDLNCQSRAVLCKTRGDSLTRSVQSGLQIALGSSEALVAFNIDDLDCWNGATFCEESLTRPLESRLQITLARSKSLSRRLFRSLHRRLQSWLRSRRFWDRGVICQFTLTRLVSMPNGDVVSEEFASGRIGTWT